MGYQPWYQTCTYPGWSIPLNVEGNPDNITGLSAGALTLLFHPAAGGIDVVGTGTFTIQSSNPAQVVYAPSPADVAAPFAGTLYVKAQFPGGEAVYDPIPFVISAI